MDILLESLLPKPAYVDICLTFCMGLGYANGMTIFKSVITTYLSTSRLPMAINIRPRLLCCRDDARSRGPL